MISEIIANIPLVSVWMVTYNHEKYIRQCLESVISQKTNFKFEIIIGEDFSIDGTREIVKEFEDIYPGIIKPIYQQRNVGAYRNAYEFCYPLLKGKYIACLEGDDYWTDPHKLQKQVDFLEKNLDYSICWTKYKILKEVPESIKCSQRKLEDPDWFAIIENKEIFNITLNNIFNPYATLTLTCMFRKLSLNYSLIHKMKHVKDNTVYCLCLSKGKGAILNFFGGVYRHHQGGTYSNISLVNQRYNSFLNLEEIINIIPGCNTYNLKFVRNYLLFESYNLATSISFNKVLNLYKKILLYAPLKDKIKATKKLFRIVLCKFKSVILIS